MCEFCPDDLTDINTHRSYIKSFEEQIEYHLKKAEESKIMLSRQHRELKASLRKGRIRNA